MWGDMTTEVMKLMNILHIQPAAKGRGGGGASKIPFLKEK